MLNKSMGQMYPWPNLYTFNPLGGACFHRCKYCYVDELKKWPVTREKFSGKPRLVKSALTENLGTGKIIFVQDCGDIMAEDIPDSLLIALLKHLNNYPFNTYLFQTKNPKRLAQFSALYPPKIIFGTTLETNKYYEDGISRAPSPEERAKWLSVYKCEKMVSIEPILEFDLMPLVEMIRAIEPRFVSIGADSKSHGLKEPTAEAIDELIHELKAITAVRIKPNLTRLVGNISIYD